jgi:hypothetical protein
MEYRCISNGGRDRDILIVKNAVALKHFNRAFQYVFLRDDIAHGEQANHCA